MYRGTIQVAETELKGQINWMFRSIGRHQKVYVNGRLLADGLSDDVARHEFALSADWLKPGNNVVAIVAEPFVKKHAWDNVNVHPGDVQVVLPAAQWQRKTFNGLAQIIIQSTRQPGDIVLTATSKGLKSGSLVIKSLPAKVRPGL